ncbi:1,4-alpha-glucan branching protein GlgB [bacterium]|nr:MAG: 1,4-alpha-glucan branching protein GlgB [bacterium]
MGLVVIEEKLIAQLEEGRFNDPFSVLGTHKVDETTSVIRVFQPYVKQVEIVFGGKTKSVQASRINDSALFEATVKNTAIKKGYTLKITQNDDSVIEKHDAYAFGPQITEFDLQIWGEGNHEQAYRFMGSHLVEVDGVKGVTFVVWAPSASRVSVVGPFNNWDGRLHIMRKYHDQGLWEMFIPGLEAGTLYKYEIATPFSSIPFLKSDPYAFESELRPKTASIVSKLDGFKWTDDEWVANREKTQALDAPISIYEVHLGSWKRKGTADNDFLSYRELAAELIPYVLELGFTHIELLPIAEHPYDPSWGYQVTGYFAPTSRFGSPHDFMFFIDECHKHGIGVIVDWVPAHFTKDDHGLRLFDGTHLYEHADPRQGEHKDWGTNIFNFGRAEILNFLISNALFWVDKYHIDGLRVDAVASMLYLDYSRKEGEWVPNKFGGRENLEAIEFLKKFNIAIHKTFPGTVTMAEESTAWPMVSRPTYIGGLGFDFKWNMGWMNDTLKYIEVDPLFRRYHQNQLTFSMIYAFTENFVLPFSHDEVVHGKRSMISKMPGDDWQKAANLRLLLSYMYAHPGKKLLFMGTEFGQWGEWNFGSELDWPLLNFDRHKGIKQLIEDLNTLYKYEAAMYEVDYDWEGFEWIDFSDAEKSVISFMRYSKEKEDEVLCLFNFTPVVYKHYKVGVPEPGEYVSIYNSDHERYGGSHVLTDPAYAVKGEWQGHPYHIHVTVPPLAGMFFKKN